jgi:hypothetical protein
MSKPSTLEGPWKQLATAMGGVAELAKAIGIGPATLYRWAHGGTPPNLFTQKAVNEMARKRKIKPPFKIGE